MLNEGLTPDKVMVSSGRRLWWRCRRNGAHTWRTTVFSRTRVGSGCPECRITPRSAQEIYLAYELAGVLLVDHGLHAIEAAGRTWDVDIAIPSLQLIVEFDGSYWHRSKQAMDRRKAAALTSAGWRVVRVREQPLERLNPLDVQVPAAAPAFDVAVAVLARLRLVWPDLPDLDSTGCGARAEAAEQHLERLRVVKAARPDKMNRHAASGALGPARGSPGASQGPTGGPRQATTVPDAQPAAAGRGPVLSAAPVDVGRPCR